VYLCLSICFFYGVGSRAAARDEHVLHVEDVGHLLGVHTVYHLRLLTDVWGSLTY